MANDPWAPLPRTRAALEDGIARGLHLGAQLSVAHGGRRLADAAVGESSPGEPLTPEHLTVWFSSTKPVAAVALAQLWERGLLEWDDPVVRFLPEFAAHGKERITLRHLLTHTGGIRLLDVGWPAEPWEAIVAKIAAMRPEPRWIPGRKAGYHHASSWFILGEVIHRADGRPVERYVREEIFEPLGMDDCWIGMPAERYRQYREDGRIARMWNTEKRPPVPLDWDGEAHATRPHPGGNGYGPVAQFVRFYEMLLARGAAPGGGRIVTPQTVEALSARHRVGLVDQTFRHAMDWGLGFIVNSAHYQESGADTVPYGYGHHASPRTFGHSGFRSSAAFADPEAGLAVALVMNGTTDNASHEARVRAVLDAVYEDLGLAEAAGGPLPLS
jgi:CubicO group peptidase (beta-lactamase class C family)